ncbi:ABC transporter permease [Nonomuraea sp. SBT364]|uniref:ABC transporter permease n=1 Tax=Nonomuraea sp. SBT364 TaxID=1580530 RepID=UPI00066C8A0D|nr:FtsX-like permease family protein [Nonomuraea sp. SBT364]
MSAFLAALRLSRRDALRAKGRSALIMVMIGLPVLVIAALLTGLATGEVSAREKLTITMGAADARLTTTQMRGPIKQDPAGSYTAGGPRSTRPWAAAEVGALLDARLIPCDQGSVMVHRPNGDDVVGVLEVDLRDPMTRGMRPLLQGRFPAAPDEVAVTPAMLGPGVRLGEPMRVRAEERQVQVVGVVEYPYNVKFAEVVSLRGTLLLDKQDGHGTGWLADAPAPVGWEQVRALNRSGLHVASRAVTEDPPAIEPVFPSNSVFQTDLVIASAVGVVLVVLETVLLAGPAFAVGLRRRRRELAVIAAHGGSGAHLRMIVLADGLVLGGTATLAGAALGVIAAIASAPLVRDLIGGYGPPDVPWLQILGVVLLGTVTGLIAALVPAVQAARQSPAQVLAGREARVVARDRAGRPMLGLLLVVAGLGTCVLGLADQRRWLVIGAVPVVLGLVAIMPWLVRATGRLAARLPLPLRLSVRDASRHRVRTASAAAAVMAATMGAITLGIGAESQFTAVKEDTRSVEPMGTLSISGNGLDDQEWARVRAAAEEALPGVPLVTGQGAFTGKGEQVVPYMIWQSGGCERSCYRAHDLPVGDARLLALLQGRADPVAAAALAEGKVVVFQPGQVRDGKVRLGLSVENADDLELPAVQARPADPRQVGALIPGAALREAGLKVAERKLYAAHQPADLEGLQQRVRAANVDAYARVENGWDDHYPARALWLGLGLAVVLVLGGTFAATGLAAADMRRDLDTVSAVGAPPRVRRLIVAAQAGYIAGLGALVGVVAGAVMGVAAAWALTRTRGAWTGAPGEFLFGLGLPTIAVPWLFCAAIVLGLPVVAAVVAGLVTRGRPAPARRLG